MISRFKDKDSRRELFTIIKFILSAVLTILTYTTTKRINYVCIGLVELALIFIIYNLLISKSKWLRLIAEPLLFIYNAQMLILYFGNSYVTVTMLKNIKFIQDLGGQLVPYLLGTLAVLALFFLPVAPVMKDLDKRAIVIAIVGLLFAEIFINAEYKRFSPVQSFATIFIDKVRYEHIKKAAENDDVALALFHNDTLEDAIRKPADLPKQPNVIVIFTEGLSTNIINDERGVMPTLHEFEKSCITFKNYYNHTFPTLRGLQGQLYSGYKHNDDNQGNNLVSVQGILKEQGYKTAFINTEPFNEEFTLYLNNLGFDEILDDPEHVTGYAEGMTDLEAYTLLKESAHSLAADDQPFFLGIYTFGTHVSFNSKEYQFGDGNYYELNKFYNCDKMFEDFIEDFKSSELYDNTILVFTTDHATYTDQSYTETFPDYQRDCTDCDIMPMMIYHKGIEPREIDANGRNSLCFAPTLLDYLDLDIGTENYFLGSSLFDEKASTDFDTVFYDASYLASTKGGEIRYLEDLEVEEFLSQILGYYSALEAER